MSDQTQTKVVVTDIRMPFWSIVSFMVKFVIASIPAFLILSIVGFFVILILSGFLGDSGSLPQ